MKFKDFIRIGVIGLFIFAALCMSLCGCGKKIDSAQKTQIVLAVFKEDRVLTEYINEYNSKQTDYEVILKNYQMNL